MIFPTMFSSDVMDWQTPEEVLDVVRSVAPITLDPCTSPENPTGAAQWFTPGMESLTRSWNVDGLVYVNPPYGRAMREWMRKLSEEHLAGRVDEAILLIPARTDTAAWRDYVAPVALAVAFWHGRIRFRGAPAGAPFPSAFVYYGFRPRVFQDAFRDHASIMRFCK